MLYEEEASVEAVEEVEEGVEPGEEVGEAEESEEVEVSDINVALLEAMIKRTEVLEKLAAGTITAAEATKLLAEVVAPTPGATRRRRRRR
jgi:hypothetical protein